MNSRSGLPLSLAIVLAATAPARAADAERVEFNRDVRPILADKCFPCHGPDAGKRKARLRLDTDKGAKADLGGHSAVVPGKPDDSELLARVTSDDKARRMPPLKT